MDIERQGRVPSWMLTLWGEMDEAGEALTIAVFLAVMVLFNLACPEFRYGGKCPGGWMS
jgi:hypothetical protein